MIHLFNTLGYSKVLKAERLREQHQNCPLRKQPRATGEERLIQAGHLRSNEGGKDPTPQSRAPVSRT